MALMAAVWAVLGFTLPACEKNETAADEGEVGPEDDDDEPSATDFPPEASAPSPPGTAERVADPAVDPSAEAAGSTVAAPPSSAASPLAQGKFDPVASPWDDLAPQRDNDLPPPPAPASSAELRRMRHVGDNFRRKSLVGKDYDYHVFDRADLRLAKLTRARLRAASFIEADLRGAVLTEARGRAADFSRGKLSGIKALRADLSECRFTDANLVAANFYAASLRGADLRGADLTDAVLVSSDLRGARFDARTRLPIPRDAALQRGMREEGGP